MLVALLLLAQSLWIMAPVLATGSWYRSHDGMRYPYLLFRFKEAFDQGIWYPRWIPDMMGGYGYPTFVFYQPGYFYFSLPFAYFTDVVHAAYLSAVAMLTLAGWGAYKLARRCNPPWLSAVMAMMFLFSPYIATNIFLRGDYSELFAMLLCPWGVHFALRVCDKLRAGGRIRGNAAGFVAATAGIVVMHPFVAFFYLPFAALLFISKAWNGGWRRQTLCIGALLLALSLTVSAPYWFTLFQMKEYVRYQGALSGMYVPFAHLKSVTGSLFRNQMPVGLFYLLAAAGFALGWKRGGVSLRVAAAYLFLLVFLTLHHSRFIWELGYPVLKYLQFPWRQHSVAATVAYLGVIQLGILVEMLRRRRPEMAYAAALAALAAMIFVGIRPFHTRAAACEAAALAYPAARSGKICAKARPLRSVEYYGYMRKREANTFMTLAPSGEFQPRGVSTRGLPNRMSTPVDPAVFAPPEAEGNALEIIRPENSHRIEFVAALKEPASVLLGQFYLPGWRVKVDGKSIPQRAGRLQRRQENEGPAVMGAGANGRVKIRFFEPGTYHVQAWYDGPPAWQWRNAVLLALGALLLAGVWKQAKKGSP